MSKVVPVRIQDSVLEEISQAILAAQAYTAQEPYTVSSWIRKAIKEKLEKLERGRRPRGRKKGGPDWCT